ncbi:DUF3877 family protein [Anaerocolumna sp. AGMB13025]|uniref:DUF3877 family protein n=1 Tax=Anaerocolumna sp. AGMB13025 TaxID=3039116 RepID=UPI00241F732C|nr:DUF3877 family protein [Anaerocolumna sp. AGMB13025]WFR59383.1 DUF3877 family protein [Anaerocolumna sp. AGMB13025]
MADTTGFKDLEENIETTIYEGLLKLGYQNNESFSIYYDLDLLNYLLGTSFETNEECLNYLKGFITFVNERYVNLRIDLERKRFRVTVPWEGISYIYRKNENNLFLKELIQTVNTHSFTLLDILDVFRRYSEDYICEEIDNSEFQYVIYFKDNTVDKFKYCFTFDQMGGYYHRLLDFSYNKILQE